jgi:hypothetical protein
MQPHHLANHQVPATRQIADFERQAKLAFHVNVRFSDARRLHQIARNRRQAGSFEFIHVGSEVTRGHVHLLGDLFGDDVDHELARLCNIAKRVFARLRPRPSSRAKTNHRRIRADRSEEAERRQIPNALWTDSRDKSNRPRNDSANQYLVNVLIVGCPRIEDQLARLHRLLLHPARPVFFPLHSLARRQHVNRI